MKNDLITILKNLQKKDLKNIRLLLKSQYFYDNKNLVILFEELCLNHPLIELEESDKVRIYKKIYGDVQYIDSTIRSMIHQLLSVVEQFLLLEYFKKHEIEREFALLEEFRDRKVDFFSKRINRLDIALSRVENLFKSENLLNRFKLTALYLNESISNDKVLHRNTIDFQLKGINKSYNYLELFFFLESISDYVITEIYQKTCNIELPQNELFKTINPVSIRKKFSKDKIMVLVIDLYELLFLAYKNFTKSRNYNVYKEQLNKCVLILSRSELLNHYHYLISYCILKKNISENSAFFKNELWDIYSKLLRENLLVENSNQYLDLNLYRSILFLGLSLKKFEEVQNFIDKYSKKVNPSEYININRLSYAFLYYEMKEYEKSLDNAIEIIQDDFIFKYDVKNLMVKIYFELNYTENLMSLIQGYRKFIKNDYILNKTTKIQFSNFLSFVEKLVKYTLNKNNLETEYQMNLLFKSTSVYAKDWLTEKYSQQLNIFGKKVKNANK